MKTEQSQRIHQNECNQPRTKDIHLFRKKGKVNAGLNADLKKLQQSDLKKVPCCYGLQSTSKSDSQNDKRKEPVTSPSWKRVDPIGAATDPPPLRISPMKPVSDRGKYRWNNNFVRNGPKIDLFKRGKFRKFDHVKSKIDSHLARIVDQKPIYSYAKQHRKAGLNRLPKQKQNYTFHSQNTTRQKKLPKDYSASTQLENQDDSHRKLSHDSIYISSQKHDQSDVSSNQRMSPDHDSQTGHTPFYGFFVPWQSSVPFISGCVPCYVAPISQDNTQIHPSQTSLVRTVSGGNTSQQHFFPAALAGIVDHVGPALYLVVGYISVAHIFCNLCSHVSLSVCS